MWQSAKLLSSTEIKPKTSKPQDDHLQCPTKVNAVLRVHVPLRKHKIYSYLLDRPMTLLLKPTA